MSCRTLLLAGLSLPLAAAALAQTAPATGAQGDRPLRAMDIYPTPMPTGSVAGAAPVMTPGRSIPATSPMPDVGTAPIQGQAIGSGSTPIQGTANTPATPPPAR